MSKKELEIENSELKAQNYILKEQLAQLRGMVFGAKRERFIAQTNPNQGVLFEEEVEVVAPKLVEKVVKTTIQPKRKAPVRNSFPESIRREEAEIIPDEVMENEADFVKIGEDITELLAYTPAEIHVKKIIRSRYARKTETASEVSEDLPTVVQSPIPLRLIPKGMVDESLIAQIIVEKIQFHTPIHRFTKKLKQLGIDFIKEKNLQNWFHRAAESLLPLYHLLQQDVLATQYIQADETRIQVLSKLKINASHRGQMWVYFAPTIKATFFNYEPTRSTEAADVILEGYQGIIQSDGYSVYQEIAQRQGIQLTHCMAHARRKFYDAKESEPLLVDFILKEIQTLYKIEEFAREKGMNDEQRLEWRQKKALPILKELKTWLLDKTADRTLLPKSQIRTAIDYSLNLWKGLEAYAQNGKLEIDNNLVENTIRPVALGRKNYLFAGSHNAAQNLAILYSLVGTCEKNDINVYKYFNWLLPKIAQEKITPHAVNWLPHRIDPKILDG